MMSVDYEKIPYWEPEDKNLGLRAIKHYSYNREIDEMDFSDLYEGYHTHDYFGFNLPDAFEDSDFVSSKKEQSKEEKGKVLVLTKEK